MSKLEYSTIFEKIEKKLSHNFVFKKMVLCFFYHYMVLVFLSIIIVILHSSHSLWCCVCIALCLLLCLRFFLLYLFFIHLIIKRQQPCYSCPYWQKACAWFLAFCWDHVVHSKFTPLYMYKLAHKLVQDILFLFFLNIAAILTCIWMLF
jgi:hypothetical protein